MFTPCRDCNKRHVGCHSSCEDYKKFLEEYERFKKYTKEHAPPVLTKWSWDGYTDTMGKRRRHDGKFS